MKEQELLIEQLMTKNKKLLSICNKQTNELKKMSLKLRETQRRLARTENEKKLLEMEIKNKPQEII